MKKLFLTGLVVFSMLLAPIASTSFDVSAGRTTHGYGGEYCQCGQSNGPCYDEVTWERCDIIPSGSMVADSGESQDSTAKGVPGDYTSGVLLLFAAALLTSRVIRFP